MAPNAERHHPRPARQRHKRQHRSCPRRSKDIAGPFDLGCKASKNSGKTRIPADTDESTTGLVAPIQ